MPSFAYPLCATATNDCGVSALYCVSVARANNFDEEMLPIATLKQENIGCEDGQSSDLIR
jgi:hypothetical protein